MLSTTPARTARHRVNLSSDRLNPAVLKLHGADIPPQAATGPADATFLSLPSNVQLSTRIQPCTPSSRTSVGSSPSFNSGELGNVSTRHARAQRNGRRDQGDDLDPVSAFCVVKRSLRGTTPRKPLILHSVLVLRVRRTLEHQLRQCRADGRDVRDKHQCHDHQKDCRESRSEHLEQ